MAVGYVSPMLRSSESLEPWQACIAVVRPALLLAPPTYLQDLRARLVAEGVQDAVARHDTPTIYRWIVRLLNRQGISNAAAVAYAERHGSADWHSFEVALRKPLCPKLRSYWHFEGCGYRKDAGSCARPDLLPLCALPRLPARKGALNQAAFSLALFVRDICSGDFVAWIDSRLASGDSGAGVIDRAACMRNAVVEPLMNIAGTGPKVWSMVLAELLVGGDSDRERWVTTGSSFVAIDSLVHAYLSRTGILQRLKAEHRYGPSCYEAGGCSEVITTLASRIDAREFNRGFPAVFPRWVQFAIWGFCAADGWNTCNAIRIDDRLGCRQQFCPSFRNCDRLPVGL